MNSWNPVLVAAGLAALFPILSRIQWVPTDGPHCGGKVGIIYAHGKIVKCDCLK